MTDPDRDLSRLLDRLAGQAPPSPDARHVHARWRRHQARRAVAALGIIVGTGAILAAAWPSAPTPAPVPAAQAEVRPAPAPMTPPTALDPGLDQADLINAIAACLALPADAALDLRKDAGVLQVAGPTPVPLDRLRRLDGLLARVASLDLRFKPGARPHLRLFLVMYPT
jgi:hypothetical protein